MRLNFLVLGISVAGCSLFFPSPVPAQSLQLEPDGSVALLFTKPLSAFISIQQSTDLRLWTPADSVNQILSQNASEEVIRSLVGAAPTAAKLYFRLQVENGWKIALTWNRSPSSDVSGYCLHYGVASGNYSQTLDVGNRLAAIVSLPLSTKTCYFVVTAYNDLGFQSTPSREVKVRLRSNETNRSARPRTRGRPR